MFGSQITLHLSVTSLVSTHNCRQENFKTASQALSFSTSPADSTQPPSWYYLSYRKWQCHCRGQRNNLRENSIWHGLRQPLTIRLSIQMLFTGNNTPKVRGHLDHKTGPSMAMVLFQSRCCQLHSSTICGVSFLDCARYCSCLSRMSAVNE